MMSLLVHRQVKALTVDKKSEEVVCLECQATINASRVLQHIDESENFFAEVYG